MISQEKWMILTTVQKLPKNEEDLGKYIAAKGLKKLSKVKKNRPIWSHCRYLFQSQISHLLTYLQLAANVSMISSSSSMELFSKRRWPSGLAQQSNMYWIMPCMCCIIFWARYKHNRFLLGLIQPSSPSIKELHGSTYYPFPLIEGKSQRMFF